MSTLTFLLMDAPYEQARTATAFRLIDAALRREVGVRVFAYEGAVSLSMTSQKPHANAVHGRTLEEEAHPTPHAWVGALIELAAGKRRALRLGQLRPVRGRARRERRGRGRAARQPGRFLEDEPREREHARHSHPLGARPCAYCKSSNRRTGPRSKNRTTPCCGSRARFAPRAPAPTSCCAGPP